MSFSIIDCPGQPVQQAQNRVRTKPIGLWLWVAFLCMTLGWDTSGSDMRVMAWLADGQGFALRDHWWLSTVLHDGAKRLAIVIYLGIVCLTFWPRGFWRQIPRLRRLEIVMGIILSLLVISTLKRFSMTSCPWELQAFGGVASYVSHWSWGVTDGGSGHCFPGGHASSAMAFMALSLPWLMSHQRHEQRTGQQLLVAIVLIGLVLGAAQTLRGAHYPSHTAWTGLICAAVAWLNHSAFALLAKSNPRLFSGARMGTVHHLFTDRNKHDPHRHDRHRVDGPRHCQQPAQARPSPHRP